MTGKMKLNRTQIRYIAIAAMLIDHTAALLLPPEKYPALTILYVLMRTVGRIAGPVMFYFLAEGYRYTSSKLRYGIRLLSFGILSQIPYSLAKYGQISLSDLNVIVTLFMSFMMLVVAAKVNEKVLKGIVVFIFMILTTFSDWGILGPFMVWLFYIYREDRKKQLVSFASLCVALLVATLFVVFEGNTEWYECLCQIGNLLVILLLWLYNGEIGSKNRFNHWFFYVFYPAHLMLLYLV